MCMSKVGERLSQMISDLEELKFQVEQSKTLFEQDLKHAIDVGQIRSVEPEIITLQRNASFRNLAATIELYHHQIAIIKKGSPKVGAELEVVVNGYEKKSKELLNNFLKSLTTISKKNISKKQKIKQKDLLREQFMNESTDAVILAYQLNAGIYTAMTLLVDFLEMIRKDMYPRKN